MADKLEKPQYCKCNYAMYDYGYYYMCSKCFKVRYKTDIKSRIQRRLIEWIKSW